MDLQLNYKTALVTGSSKGIGEAIVRRLAQEQATVVVHGRDRNATGLVAQEIVANGGRAFAVTGDLTHDTDVQQLVDQVQTRVGRIDILVNNAGGSGGTRETWSSASPEAWMATFDRNVLATLRVTMKLLPAMQQEHWGRIINISSLAATMPPPAAADYAAAKAAINAMTGSLARAVAADGVTVNAISPGTIHSATLDKRFREAAAERGMTDEGAPWEEIERVVLPSFAQVPLGRVGRLDEIASIITFLSSPLAGYITGVNLRVDGGMSPSL